MVYLEENEALTRRVRRAAATAGHVDAVRDERLLEHPRVRVVPELADEARRGRTAVVAATRAPAQPRDRDRLVCALPARDHAACVGGARADRLARAREPLDLSEWRGVSGLGGVSTTARNTVAWMG